MVSFELICLAWCVCCFQQSHRAKQLNAHMPPCESIGFTQGGIPYLYRASGCIGRLIKEGYTTLCKANAFTGRYGRKRIVCADGVSRARSPTGTNSAFVTAALVKCRGQKQKCLLLCSLIYPALLSGAKKEKARAKKPESRCLWDSKWSK